MSTEPTVSIVLPVYNGERYLHEAIESVLAQTYESWELIVVDDCSSDSTPAIAAEFVRRDNRVHYKRNKTNKKLPASLNAGFADARGKYFTWISDDNLFRSDALEIMAQALDSNPQVDLVHCRMQRIDENGEAISPLALPQSGTFIYCVNVVLACFLYRREVHEKLGGYDESLFLVEDYDFWLRAYRTFTFKSLKDAPYFYRVHSETLTNTRALDIRNRACQIIRRETKRPELNVYKKACAWVGLAVNSLRKQLVQRKHTRSSQSTR